jgi:hypothetical protein
VAHLLIVFFSTLLLTVLSSVLTECALRLTVFATLLCHQLQSVQCGMEKCVIKGETLFGGGGGRGTCKAKWTTLSLSFKLIFFLEDVSAFVPFCTSTNSELDISIAVVVTTFLSNCNILITNHLSILYLIVACLHGL